MLQQLLHFAGVDISPGQRAGTGAVEHLDPVMKEAGPAIELVHQVKADVLPVGTTQAGEVADGVGMYGGGFSWLQLISAKEAAILRRSRSK